MRQYNEVKLLWNFDVTSPMIYLKVGRTKLIKQIKYHQKCFELPLEERDRQPMTSTKISKNIR